MPQTIDLPFSDPTRFQVFLYLIIPVRLAIDPSLSLPSGLQRLLVGKLFPYILSAYNRMILQIL